MCLATKTTYRKSNSFWGEILVELGIRNKLLARKNLYLRWHDNRNGMRSAIEHGRLEVQKGYLISCIDHSFDSKRFMNFGGFENYLKLSDWLFV